MIKKIKRISNYLLYILLTNVIYGLILFFVSTSLAKYSLSYAYLGNIALIIIGLALDEYNLKMLQSKNLVMQIKKDNDSLKNYRLIQWIMNNFVSFKTILYVFYVFILMVSQITDFNPTLISGDLEIFIFTNRYSILLLIGFDRLIKQFSNDRIRINKISSKFNKYWNEYQD
ncbi:MAG: hypothetical protein FWH54_04970 [Methanobrevibacter sp.]|nr:hypothetical protein [Methanobrevibacter sp.]